MTLPLVDYTVSTVTCAFTEARWSDLVAALRSLQAQTRPPDEVILVVDNNPALLRRAQIALPDVVVIPNSHSRGASGARNSGAEQAHSDIVAFLDDDAVADPDWLERLLIPFWDIRVAGVGGEARPRWPDSRPRWFPREFDWVVGCSYVGLPLKTGVVRNLIGTNMSVRRDLMASVAGFREGFGNVVLDPAPDAKQTRLSTCEETDFCIRLTQIHRGMTWVYEPGAKVSHRVHHDRTTFRYFLARCWLEGKGKALLGRLLGESVALDAERVYVRYTLPRAILAGLAKCVNHGHWERGLQAGAIAAGLATSATSYVVHRYSPGETRRDVRKLVT